MADENPFAKYAGQPDTDVPVNPFAKYVSGPEVGTAEDMAKTAPSSAVRAAIGATTMGGTLSDLMGRGAEWAINKVAPDSKAAAALKFLREVDTDSKTGKSISDQQSFFPSYDTVKGKVENKITGPLHDPETAGGKALGAGIETVPAVLGGPILGTLGKAVGAGIGSGVLGESAKAAGDYLPSWAEPVARVIGAMGGTALPTGARRAVTPLPLSPERAAEVAILKGKNPELATTPSAGQISDKPWLLATEGRAPAFRNQAAKQEEAYTKDVMREMGVDGLATPGNVAKGDDIGKAIRGITVSGRIDPPLFAQLNQEVTAAKKQFERAAGKHNSQSLQDVEQEIKLGASKNPNVNGMTGERYQYLRQSVQADIDAASTGEAKTALAKVRDSLDRAFSSSLSTADAEKLKKLQTQYANYKVITNHANINPSTDTVTPKDVRSAVSGAWGKSAINEDRGTLAPAARNAGKFMQELPKPVAGTAPPLFDLLSSATNSAVHGLAGAHLGGGMGALGGAGEGWVSGHLSAPALWNMSANTVARVLASKKGQEYLKNQKWMPGASTQAPDKETLLRLLMSPPEVQTLPGQSR